MKIVALIGPDGTGKTTIAHAVAAHFDDRARYLYMGVNLEASTLMLPTTRLILALKRRRGGRPDLRGVNEGAGGARTHRRPTLLGAVRSAARTANWIAEESFRHTIAEWHRWRRRIVILDRLFFADYHAIDVAGVDPARPVASRVHGFVLSNVYRRPDLVILLDAPADVLHARKPETSLEYLERRREEYRAVASAVRRFEIVDVRGELDDAVRRVVDLIEEAGASARSMRTGG